jgi:hypothetical protein
LIDIIDKIFSLEFTVGSIQGGGAHKVRASGHGLTRGEVNSTSTNIRKKHSAIVLYFFLFFR